MPVDFQQILTRIREIGAGARQRQERLKNLQEQARSLLGSYSSQLELLRSRVEAARKVDPTVRCALPVDEPLTFTCPPPAVIPDATLIAADGSQINPDRHAALQFCVVNVGLVTIKRNSGLAPEIATDTELLYGDDLLTNGFPMTDGMVALRRDLKERAMLDELSWDFDGPIVTMTDGPIELWGARGEDAQAYGDFVEKYKIVLSRLGSRGVITAGYVEKPSANLVGRLLEIVMADDAQLKKVRDFHPLRGVSDRWLYGETRAPLLPPGHRSAVFGLQSGSDKTYTGILSLHFFYLNVGDAGHPWPVRVEIPRWVLDDRQKLDILHAVLVEQCRIMGSKPYPYILHRAHETAVVRREETQIEQMLSQELRLQGEDPDVISPKQTAKDHPGR